MEKSYYISANAVKYEDRYFTLRAFGDNYTGHYSSPEIYWTGAAQDDTIYYSKNWGSTWTSATYDGEHAIEIPISLTDKVMFKGTNSCAGTFFVGQEDLDAQVLYSISFIAEGNIMSLIAGDNFASVTTLTTDSCFASLFAYNIYNIINVENLILPATVLSDNCYERMFYHCYFKIPPVLPATHIAAECYKEMFAHNDLLEQLPLLIATNLTHDGCEYQDMFWDCDKIKISETQNANYMTPYRIPASGTATAGDSQVDMFRGTGGTFQGNYDGNYYMVPINTTYYTSNKIREK